MINDKLYFNFLVFMMLATTFLPIVSNNLPPYVGSFHLYTALFGFSILVFNIRVLLSKNM